MDLSIFSAYPEGGYPVALSCCDCFFSPDSCCSRRGSISCLSLFFHRLLMPTRVPILLSHFHYMLVFSFRPLSRSPPLRPHFLFLFSALKSNGVPFASISRSRFLCFLSARPLIGPFSFFVLVLRILDTCLKFSSTQNPFARVLRPFRPS